LHIFITTRGSKRVKPKKMMVKAKNMVQKVKLSVYTKVKALIQRAINQYIKKSIHMGWALISHLTLPQNYIVKNKKTKQKDSLRIHPLLYIPPTFFFMPRNARQIAFLDNFLSKKSFKINKM
jgi:hypothetical protein